MCYNIYVKALYRERPDGIIFTQHTITNLRKHTMAQHIMTIDQALAYITSGLAAQSLKGHVPDVTEYSLKAAKDGEHWTVIAVHKTERLHLTDEKGTVGSRKSWALYDNGTVIQCDSRQTEDANIWEAVMV